MHESVRLIGLVVCALGFAACEYPSLAQFGDGGGGTDAVGASDRLTFSLTDFTLAQAQTVRLHVLLVHLDGTRGDVTENAMYTSDNETFAAISGKGLIKGGSQPGSATITARLGAAMTATLKATTTSALCHPVINELLTGSVVAGSDEWVEIYNPCTNVVDVSGWTLVYRGPNTTGAQDTAVLITLNGQMAPGDLRLYAGTAYPGVSDGMFAGGTGLASSDGAVGLRAGPKDTGPLVDSMAYGAVSPMNPFIEANPIPAMAAGKSASRLPFDGKDDNNGATDFEIISTPTPRALNVP